MEIFLQTIPLATKGNTGIHSTYKIDCHLSQHRTHKIPQHQLFRPHKGPGRTSKRSYPRRQAKWVKSWHSREILWYCTTPTLICGHLTENGLFTSTKLKQWTNKTVAPVHTSGKIIETPKLYPRSTIGPSMRTELLPHWRSSSTSTRALAS